MDKHEVRDPGLKSAVSDTSPVAPFTLWRYHLTTPLRIPGDTNLELHHFCTRHYGRQLQIDFRRK
jgi:hypothetical protein